MSAGDFLSGLRAASVSGAVIAGTVWLLRPLFQDRTPRRVFCGLWDAALVRFLILGELVSPVSVQRWLPGLLRPSVPSSHAGMGVMEPPVPVGEAVFETAAAYGETAIPAASFWNRETVLLLLWQTVALLLAGGFLWTHLRSRRIYGASLPWEDPAIRVWRLSHPLRRSLRVRISDRIAAPLTYGVLRPVILLPKGLTALDGEALSCVLEHEYAHIRRFDTLRKSFLALVLCLHWFNPAAWALFLLSNRELELACDEAVTDRGSDKARYARTLLDLEERRGQWGLSGSHFSQNALEERIKVMMREKHRSLAAGIALVAVISIVVTVFASAAPSVPDLARGGTAGDVSETNRQTAGTPSAPSEEEVLSARSQALAGMTREQVERLNLVVREANLWWEHEYQYMNIFGLLEDPDDLYWSCFDQKGEDVQIGWAFDGDLDMAAVCEREHLTEEEFYARYGTPVTTEVKYNAYDFIAILDELIEAAHNEDLKAALSYVRDESRDAVDGHSMEHANNEYKALHDLDYFLLRYGPSDVGPYVQDSSTISKYYGTLGVFYPEAAAISHQHSSAQVIEGDTLIREIDGERQYSTDGGETWLSEEGFQEQYGEIDVEWWTAEDYEQWLEEEKKDLQSIIGERGYTSSEGWFTWDQKRVDEAIALYESILEDIKKGALYSKSISYDGGATLEEGIVLSCGGDIFSYREQGTLDQWPVDVPALLEALKAFGLSGDETRLTYNGQRVRILVDGADVGDREYAVNYVYYDPQGELDLHSLRQATPNGDGSYDPLGKLTGLAKRGDRGFDQGLIDCARYDGRVEAVTAAGKTSEKLEKYVPFGLQYENAGQLRMYWNGKSVHSLYDTEEGTWFANNLNGTELGEDAVDLETVYENGKLRGLRVSDPESLHTETTTAIGNSSGERGRTFEEIFAQYEPYGLLYSPRNAAPGSLSWNGRAVRSFADQKPGGGAFSYEDPYAQDGLRIRTEYDEAGRLTGLKEV